jgi:hypothetical protein
MTAAWQTAFRSHLAHLDHLGELPTLPIVLDDAGGRPARGNTDYSPALAVGRSYPSSTMNIAARL